MPYYDIMLYHQTHMCMLRKGVNNEKYHMKMQSIVLHLLKNASVEVLS